MKRIVFVICTVLVFNVINLNATTVNDQTITNDNLIYESIVQEVESGEHDIETPYMILDPYDRSPLTGYIGFTSSQEIKPSLFLNDNLMYTSEGYSNMFIIPVRGLFPDYLNKVSIHYTLVDGTSQIVDTYLQTEPLPSNIGDIDVTYQSEFELENDLLIFDSIASGYHTGIDSRGNVRWYNSDLDTFGNHFFEHLEGDYLITQNADYDQLIVFDFNGRIYDYFTVDYPLTHDIFVIDGDKVIISSEDPQIDTPIEDYTIEDQFKVYDVNTWQEIYNLDYRLIFDQNRQPQPIPTPSNEYEHDWFHLNSTIYSSEENMFISSARQQNIVVATDASFVQDGEEDISGVRWILGSPDTWEGENVYSLFLTPVDSNGNELYDFNDKADLELANSEFFNWGQHSVVELELDNDPDTFDFMIFDDGNYSSYDSDYWVPADLNTSRVAVYRVNESNMTVELLYDFGQELGNDYYSSFVGNVDYLEDQNLIMIAFGGTNLDLNLGVNVGVPIEVPLFSDPTYDYNENWLNILEKTRVVFVDPNTDEIVYGFDHYNKDAMGLFNNFTYKVTLDHLYN